MVPSEKQMGSFFLPHFFYFYFFFLFFRKKEM